MQTCEQEYKISLSTFIVSHAQKYDNIITIVSSMVYIKAATTTHCTNTPNTEYYLQVQVLIHGNIQHCTVIICHLTKSLKHLPPLLCLSYSHKF